MCSLALMSGKERCGLAIGSFVKNDVMVMATTIVAAIPLFNPFNYFN